MFDVRLLSGGAVVSSASTGVVELEVPSSAWLSGGLLPSLSSAVSRCG